jgi:hypothetical protein
LSDDNIQNFVIPIAYYFLFFLRYCLFYEIEELYCSCSASEQPLPDPIACPCENGGSCTLEEDGSKRCICPDSFSGPDCSVHVARRKLLQSNVGVAEAVAIPIVVILILVLTVGVYMLLKRRSL